MPESKIRVGAVAQARNGSSRFPRKVFAEIAGRPVLWHIIERLRRCETLDEIVIATSTRNIDREINDYARTCGVGAFRGSENDVQSRFLDAADEFELDVIVRICGDSPFIDPAMIDRLVTELLAAGGDYAEPDPATPAAYEGMEAVTVDALKRSRKLGDKGPDREHVTRYIRNHPTEFKLVHPIPEAGVRGEFRLSVDNQADLRFARAVYDGLHRPGEIFTAHDLAGFLRDHPQIHEMNAHVRQKDTAAKNFHVVFFIDAAEITADLLELARRLNENWHCGIGFVGEMRGEEKDKLAGMGYRTACLSKDDSIEKVEEVLKTWDANLILVPEAANSLRQTLQTRGWKVAGQSESAEKLMEARGLK